MEIQINLIIERSVETDRHSNQQTQINCKINSKEQNLDKQKKKTQMFNFLKQFNKNQLTQFTRYAMSSGKGKGAKPAGEKPAAEKPAAAADKKPAGEKPKKK
ncbi:hypothetical protein TTHERM_01080490 (macronuclear) [Tetrahymena thermophila SB210]|uniref:Uncharacterized protein n=1 Tax=Tetrahymena thermophila (strain SB210) TaxID=312017 RepID=Q22C21_TETTS|nr:hypothetical protein TTHERM_01080490 [Tetrahymena thermophila SB210]EAR82841.2 hypothetical protein TTHERM_01080490 [Tetrahymena thermophila SB210]|eukprot:XP_001030504.2 hypothetical protein TTHERM_01080490 [Tetrahymena thermophila SB210]